MKNSTIKVAAALAVAMMAASAEAESIWLKKKAYMGVQPYNRATHAGFKSFFGVWPVAAGHTAGAVWTDNGWATVNWSTARWCRNVAGAYGNTDEEWSVGAIKSVSSWSGAPGTFTFALYVDNGKGQRFWDNNGGRDYQVYRDNVFWVPDGVMVTDCSWIP